jgi:glycine oxidase
MADDILIVGGGVIGCGLGYELASAGRRVVVLERESVGAGATGASAGMLTTLADAMKGGPLAAFAARAREATEDLVGRVEGDTGVSTEHRRCGALRLGTDEKSAAELRSWVERAPAHYRLRWLSSDELQALEPAVEIDCEGALLSETEGLITPACLATALSRGIVRRGGEVREGVLVTGLLREGARVVGVDTSDGLIHAGRVVLTAGAWTGLLHAHLPALPVCGQMVSLLPSGHGLGRIVLALGRYLTPRTDGSVWVGATEEEVGFHSRVTGDGLAWLTVAAARIAPSLGEGRFLRAWAGLRPGTPDGLPVMGEVPGHEGLSVSTAHFVGGIMYSALVSRLMAQHLLGQATDVDLQPFSPARLS